ncbi:MAG: YigZ family protein [Mycoplasmoidaceae bacterium]|nr:YigZ family protein [Mycoplasmoidaceae bacterium]
MKVLKKSIKTSFTIKKSKFICLGYLVHNKLEVKTILDQIKKEYSDASHICYGYILDDNNYYYSDDGEPSGCAGKPIYNAIQSRKLNYCLLIIVRYFGGVKFGTSLLRSTFKDLSLEVLSEDVLRESVVTDLVDIQINYSQLKLINKVFNKSIYYSKYKTDVVDMTLMGDSKNIKAKLKLLNVQPKHIKEKQVI